jgi:hypothetical protein
MAKMHLTVSELTKRTADSLVSKGKDLPDTFIMYCALSSTDLSSVRLFYMDESNIAKFDKMLTNVTILIIKGIMKIHQVISEHESEITHRVLSCFCAHPSFCNCFQLAVFAKQLLVSIVLQMRREQ